MILNDLLSIINGSSVFFYTCVFECLFFDLIFSD